MRVFSILIGLTIWGGAPAQVILTEVMFDPAGPEASDEFVEIYNLGSEPVDLSGWQIGDGVGYDFLAEVAGHGFILHPQQYAVILDLNYFLDSSSTYNALIPPEALILTIDGTTLGSGGLSNSTAETIILINAALDTLQRYLYSIGNIPGRSDEKIELSEDNSPANWGDSRHLHGTPGSRNTLTRPNLDLAITRFELLNNTLMAGANAPFELVIKNLGRVVIGDFRWETFYDWSHNRWPEEDEIQDVFLFSGLLPPDDSLEIAEEFRNLPFGEIPFGVAVRFNGDGDSSNNVMVKSALVDNPAGVGLVINEIMFEPRTGLAEWVELYNNGGEAINLRYLFFADARDTTSISTGDDFLKPGEYMVLGRDSAIAGQYPLAPEQLRVRSGFPTLNNDFDDLRLLGPTFITYDRVNYSRDWYGRAVEPGTSLEKLNPAFNGQIKQNWAASAASVGSTPGKENSLLITTLPLHGQLKITPNPFSPDGDGREDFAAIHFQLPGETAFINLRIFDTRGRLIRRLADGDPAGNRGQFVWDGKDDQERIARIGAYICLLEGLNTERRVQTELKKVIILVKK